MKRLIPLASALALSTACYSDADILEGDVVDSDEQAVVNGQIAPAGSDPAVVFLGLGGGSCSGTLISPRVVLTARHCTENANPGNIQAYFGDTPGQGGTVIGATDIRNHPTRDISMVALAQPGPTAAIPLRLAPVAVGQATRIVGWGVTGEVQQDAGVKRIGNSTVTDVVPAEIYIGGTAGDSKSCYGDSGGPYFTAGANGEEVMGVVSRGTDACEVGLSIGVRVDAHADFIQTYIQEIDPATCGQDGLCVQGCATVDPDCCVQDGACEESCAAGQDVDCGGGTGPDEPNDPQDPNDPNEPNDPQDPSNPGVSSSELVGGCSASSGGASGWLALALLGLVAVRRRNTGEVETQN